MSIEAELARIANCLERIAAGLEPLPSGTVTHASPPQPVAAAEPPTVAVTHAAKHAGYAPPFVADGAAAPAPAAITIDQLRERFHALAQAGRRDALLALLGEFGAQRLPDLGAEHYPSLAERLSELEAA